MLTTATDKKALRIVWLSFLMMIAFGWITYALVGHHIIRVLYDSDIPQINAFAPGKHQTPLSHYLKEADRLLKLSIGLAFAVLLVVTVLIRTRLHVKVAVVACSFFISSILIFSFFEVFPSLITVFHLDKTSYYSARLDYVPDATLRKRNRPSFSREIPNFRGSNYSPVYDLDVPPTTIEWSTDEDGFRNSQATSRADVVVIGDSFVEYGNTEADTVGKKLENLTGLTVRNLGVSGYGPDQYLEVLKRYAVKLHPKYAFFFFYEGNDIADIREYAAWRTRTREDSLYEALAGPFWVRYKAAMRGIFTYVERTIFSAYVLAHRNIFGRDRHIHPDVAVLNLHGKYFSRVFFGFFPRKRDVTPEELLSSRDWQRLREILTEFKRICTANSISPIIIYVPTDVHIYASYSTQDSGENWLQKREDQIAVKAYSENAMKKLAQELDFDLISLTPAFESAAEEGRMLYYPLDSHWNPEGIQVAAEFVAQALTMTSNHFSHKREVRKNIGKSPVSSIRDTESTQ
jgi:SGNH hydrolase-like domain, acetyltransferase AlgX